MGFVRGIRFGIGTIAGGLKEFWTKSQSRGGKWQVTAADAWSTRSEKVCCPDVCPEEDRVIR
jgi:hypothetical protein